MVGQQLVVKSGRLRPPSCSSLQDKPGTKVGVVGLGGLGHMAVQFARAFGCEVGWLINVGQGLQ